MIWRGALVLAMTMLAPVLPAQCPVPEHIVSASAAAEREVSIATQNMWRFSSKEMSPDRKSVV